MRCKTQKILKEVSNRENYPVKVTLNFPTPFSFFKRKRRIETFIVFRRMCRKSNDWKSHLTLHQNSCACHSRGGELQARKIPDRRSCQGILLNHKALWTLITVNSLLIANCPSTRHISTSWQQSKDRDVGKPHPLRVFIFQNKG